MTSSYAIWAKTDVANDAALWKIRSFCAATPQSIFAKVVSTNRADANLGVFRFRRSPRREKTTNSKRGRRSRIEKRQFCVSTKSICVLTKKKGDLKMKAKPKSAFEVARREADAPLDEAEGLREMEVQKMKVNIDWAGLAKAVLRAAWPFLAGALGGLLSGCSVFGPVVGKTAVF